MNATHRFLLGLAAMTISACMVCGPGFAQAPAGVADKPVVAFTAPQLKDWQAASENERYAFLIGLAAMLDAEREWQGEKCCPSNKALSACGARG